MTIRFSNGSTIESLPIGAVRGLRASTLFTCPCLDGDLENCCDLQFAALVYGSVENWRLLSPDTYWKADRIITRWLFRPLPCAECGRPIKVDFGDSRDPKSRCIACHHGTGWGALG